MQIIHVQINQLSADMTMYIRGYLDTTPPSVLQNKMYNINRYTLSVYQYILQSLQYYITI